jgi:hypothetical protein
VTNQHIGRGVVPRAPLALCAEGMDVLRLWSTERCWWGGCAACIGHVQATRENETLRLNLGIGVSYLILRRRDG